MAELKGFAFPFRLSGRGGVVEKTGVDKVKDNMKAIILTSIGERLMSPNVGTYGYERLFKNMTDQDVGIIKYDLTRGIENGESRVTVTDIQVTTPNEYGHCLVKVEFILNATYDQYSITVDVEI
jgi:phage baseplate assembly protein W